MGSLWSFGRNGMSLGSLLGLGLLVSAAGRCQAKNEVDPAIKHYESVSGVDGSLNSIGSDTMVNMMTPGPRRSTRSIRTSRSRSRGRARRRHRRL